MRKIILTFILVLASGFVLYCSYVCVKNINTIGSESEVKGKEMSSDEYIYKEDLLHLGYNLNDIEVIQNKISNVDVKEYFLKEKYDNISSYINALNFIKNSIKVYDTILIDYIQLLDIRKEELLELIDLVRKNNKTLIIIGVCSSNKELISNNDYYEEIKNITDLIILTEK